LYLGPKSIYKDWFERIKKKSDGFTYLEDFTLDTKFLTRILPLSNFYKRRDDSLNEVLLFDYEFISKALNTVEESFSDTNNLMDEEDGSS
jgi:hypothetical protein